MVKVYKPFRELYKGKGNPPETIVQLGDRPIEYPYANGFNVVNGHLIVLRDAHIDTTVKNTIAAFVPGEWAYAEVVV